MTMKRLTSLLVSGLALQIPVAALAADHMEFVERALTDATLDLGAKGDSAGDLLTWSNPLFDAANKTQIGSDQGYCVRIEVGKTWECSWTNLLKDGQITVSGVFYDDKDSLLSVTGGTGKYAGAKGSLKLHSRDAKSTAYTFIFDLL
jgi:allene oxide cyclase